MQSRQGRLCNSGDDELIRLLSFYYSRRNSGESEGLRFPTILHQSIPPPLSFPFQYPVMYAPDNQLGFSPSINLLMPNEFSNSRSMGFTDTTPTFASHSMPRMDHIVENRNFADVARHCGAAWLSVVAPLPDVPKSHPKTVENNGAQFMRSISQVSNTEQIVDRSGVLDHQSAFRNIHSHFLEAGEKPATQRTIASFHQEALSCTNSQMETKRDILSADASVTAVEHVRRTRPKRALTAYNIFFMEQRQVILEERRLSSPPTSSSENGKLGTKKRRRGNRSGSSHNNRIGFEEMGKMIGQRWQELDRDLRRKYEAKSQADKQRYQEELAEYLLNERNERELKLAALQATVSEDTKHRYFSRRR